MSLGQFAAFAVVVASLFTIAIIAALHGAAARIVDALDRQTEPDDEDDREPTLTFSIGDKEYFTVPNPAYSPAPEPCSWNVTLNGVQFKYPTENPNGVYSGVACPRCGSNTTPKPNETPLSPGPHKSRAQEMAEQVVPRHDLVTVLLDDISKPGSPRLGAIHCSHRWEARRAVGVLRDCIAAAIDAAIAEEREACANIVKDYRVRVAVSETSSPWGISCAVRDGLCAAIRARSSNNPPK